MDVPRLLVREAGRSDVAALSELAVQTYSRAFGHTFSPAGLAAHLEKNFSQEYFERALDEDTVLVAESAGRMIGYAQFGPVQIKAEPISGQDRELRRLYVHPDFQNRGVGALLLEAVLDHPRLKSARNIYLDVWERNLGAQRFYQRYGFEVVGEHRLELTSGAGTDRDLVMVRRAAK